MFAYKNAFWKNDRDVVVMFVSQDDFLFNPGNGR